MVAVDFGRRGCCWISCYCCAVRRHVTAACTIGGVNAVDVSVGAGDSAAFGAAIDSAVCATVGGGDFAVVGAAISPQLLQLLSSD